MNDWDWWERRLAGEPMQMSESTPHAGFYRMPAKAAYGARKTFTPVAYWPDGNGGLNCRFDGKDVSQQHGRDIWTRVGDHPVSQEAYHNKCEDEEADGTPNPNYTGRWPDEHELVPMDKAPPPEQPVAAFTTPGLGHNAPPDETEPLTFAQLEDKIDNLAREADKRLEGPPIADQDEADRIANLSDALAELHKIADASRAAERKPFDEGMKAIARKWAPILLRAELYKNLKFTLLTPWFSKAKKQAEQAAAAQAAEGAPPPKSTPKPRAGTRGRAMTLKTTKSAQIDDYPAALAFFADSEDIKKCVQTLADRAVRAGLTVPGCTVHEEEKAV